MAVATYAVVSHRVARIPEQFASVRSPIRTFSTRASHRMFCSDLSGDLSRARDGQGNAQAHDPIVVRRVDGCEASAGSRAMCASDVEDDAVETGAQLAGATGI